MAIEKGRVSMVEYLIQHGADANILAKVVSSLIGFNTSIDTYFLFKFLFGVIV